MIVANEAGMRILLLADIHANWPALQAIQEPFDVCLVLGDLVDYGIEPTPCIEWVRQRATYIIRGNHDHGVAQQVRINGKSGYRYLTGVTRILTQERILPGDRRYLGSLPICKRVTLDNTRFLLVHATPRDPLDEFAIADVDFWSRRLHDVDAQVICVGHTHHPYVLEVGDKLIVNPGSVGQPRDGPKRSWPRCFALARTPSRTAASFAPSRARRRPWTPFPRRRLWERHNRKINSRLRNNAPCVSQPPLATVPDDLTDCPISRRTAHHDNRARPFPLHDDPIPCR